MQLYKQLYSLVMNTLSMSLEKRMGGKPFYFCLRFHIQFRTSVMFAVSEKHNCLQKYFKIVLIPSLEILNHVISSNVGMCQM